RVPRPRVRSRAGQFGVLVHAPRLCPVSKRALWAESLSQNECWPPCRAGRHAAASSVAPIVKTIGAPCVLAAHSPIAPGSTSLILRQALSTAAENGELRRASTGQAALGRAREDEADDSKRQLDEQCLHERDGELRAR